MEQEKKYGEWIEMKEGNELPDYDEYVLWLTESGMCYWEALDKDGNPWIFGDDNGEFPSHCGKTTHWMRIKMPLLQIHN